MSLPNIYDTQKIFENKLKLWVKEEIELELENKVELTFDDMVKTASNNIAEAASKGYGETGILFLEEGKNFKFTPTGVTLFGDVNTLCEKLYYMGYKVIFDYYYDNGSYYAKLVASWDW